MLETERPLDVAEAIKQIAELLEHSDVEGARRAAREAQRLWPDHPRVQYWARVLQPPRVLGLRPATGQTLAQDRHWLREHAAEYPGCWLAVKGGRLIAVGRNPREVMAAVAEAGLESPPLVHYQADVTK